MSEHGSRPGEWSNELVEKYGKERSEAIESYTSPEIVQEKIDERQGKLDAHRRALAEAETRFSNAKPQHKKHWEYSMQVTKNMIAQDEAWVAGLQEKLKSF